MRLAQVSTLSATIRQDARGSVEAWLWLLTRELVRLGHEVTVFGAAGSQVDGELVATSPGPYGVNGALEDWELCEWVNLCRAVEQSARFDLLHSHAYLWGLPLQSLARAPMVHTLHIVPDHDHARLWQMTPAACVTALSQNQWNAYPQLRPAAVIPHGVDPSQFTLRTEPDDYVCYLGRFEPGKGPLQAIAAARAAGLRLLMAGPPNLYFRETVKPHIDGKTVEYVGFVTGAERNKLLGGARALLYPIQYHEAFGLVLVEAMLCGTPVVATRFGAVPEIVEPGVTGFIAETKEEFLQVIPRAMKLDRGRIRQLTEKRFSVEKMAQDYVAVYQRQISEYRQAGA